MRCGARRISDLYARPSKLRYPHRGPFGILYCLRVAKYRLTGISGGNALMSGGLQWDIVLSDKDVVAQLIDELEDKRLLWETANRERADYCAASAAYLREFIGTLLRTPSLGKELKTELKLMRGHFRTFMSDLSATGLDRPGFVDPVALERVLGWLRKPVGEQIGLLAAQYNIEVSDDLATIVPNQNDWFFAE